MNHHTFDPKTYTRRNTNRLPSYNYRSNGAYFITICTAKRQQVLEIPIIRTAVLEKWQQLPQRFTGVRLDAFVIMPDHVHGLLWLDGSKKETPTLGTLIGAFKGWVTITWRHYHKDANIPCLNHLWQRDYYEHVIRNEDDLELTREYILNNPLKALLIQEQKVEGERRATIKAHQEASPEAINP
jgi:putative transposase